MPGRIGVAVLAALLMLAVATGASARQLRFGRCVLRADARVSVRTPQVVVSHVPETRVVDAEPVTNPAYFTCLRRTGERHKLFVASSNPSPDAGYQSDIAALRVAGHYVLYVSEFIQNNPEGPATETGAFHVVDVAHHDRQRIRLPDPDIGLTRLGEVAVSVDGYMGWAQVNSSGSGTTETVEADTGSGPITVAAAPIPDTLADLAFHKLAFHGETLTWLYQGRRQSAQLKAPSPTNAAMGSLSNGSGSALAYSVQANRTANAFELSVPQGDSITGTSTPSGFSCTDTRNVEVCRNGSVQPNTPVTGSFDHSGTFWVNCGCVQLAFSADDGATWFATGTPTGPPSDSPPPPKTSTSLTLTCPPTATLGNYFSVSGMLIPPPGSGADVTITYTPPSGSSITRGVPTDSYGDYEDEIAANQSGTWTIQASYAGGQNAPSQSPACATSVH